MASVAGQFRQIALRVCDALDAAEARAAVIDSLPAVVYGLGEAGLEDLLASAAVLRSETDAVLAVGAGAVANFLTGSLVTPGWLPAAGTGMRSR